ncbi:MAG: hypothetical protein AAGI52_08055 [Bacteroidota bacterium]
MRRLLPFLVLLAACSEPPAEMPPHDAEADRLLAHVTGDAWDAVWSTSASGAARYTQTLEDLDPISGGATRQALDGLPANPLPAFLSDEPPYLDTAAREQYATRILGDTTVAGRSATLIEARFVADERRTQAIRRVRAAVADSVLLWVEVIRESDSVLFDESSFVRATLAEVDGVLVPGRADIVTGTNVPASPTRGLTTSWRRDP